jgi:hypothetical protein
MLEQTVKTAPTTDALMAELPEPAPRSLNTRSRRRDPAADDRQDQRRRESSGVGLSGPTALSARTNPMRRARTAGARGFALASALAAGALLRARCLPWGTTDEEVTTALPGDGLIPHADLTATRAVSVRAGADVVWPWIAQLGQGRGGFYSYDFLENLVGCDIHSADRIVPAWQNIAVGDEVRLAPAVGLVVASLVRGRSLVLRGWNSNRERWAGVRLHMGVCAPRRARRNNAAARPRAIRVYTAVGAAAHRAY